MISSLTEFVKNPPPTILVNAIKELPANSNYALLNNTAKIFLQQLSKNLQPGSVVVEVGIYLGSSTAILAHANPNIEIHSYDLFDNHPYDDIHDQLMTVALGAKKDRSLVNVASLLTQYSNIKLNQVEYLKEPDFDKGIDLFIEDASHCDPQLTNTLAHWVPKIKINGLLLIHDYRPWLKEGEHRYFPAVDYHVNRLMIDENWKFHGEVGSYAVFEKVA
jgi:hypothetical protein